MKENLSFFSYGDKQLSVVMLPKNANIVNNSKQQMTALTFFVGTVLSIFSVASMVSIGGKPKRLHRFGICILPLGCGLDARSLVLVLAA